MKKKLIQSIMRVCFELFVLYKAFLETGFWTMVILFILIINNELLFWTKTFVNNIPNLMSKKNK